MPLFGFVCLTEYHNKMALLSDRQIRNAEPKEKTLFPDRRWAVFISKISPKGGKWWRSCYFINGKNILQSRGYIRRRHSKKPGSRSDRNRIQLSEGINPKRKKVTNQEKVITFSDIAQEWLRVGRATHWTQKELARLCSSRLITIFCHRLGASPIEHHAIDNAWLPEDFTKLWKNMARL